MSPQDRMMIKDISDFIGVGINTIQRKPWRRKNNFPADKIGRYIVGYRPLIEKWVINKTNGKN